MVSKLFYGTNPDTTVASNIVTFDPGTIVGSNGYVQQTSFKITKVDTLINDININNMGNFQDTGPQVDVTIVGMLGESNATVNTMRRTLRGFGLRPSSATNFLYGSFGFELEDYPDFNMTPVSGVNGRGARLESIEFSKDASEVTKIAFIANLRIYGNIGTSPYTWT